MRLLAAVALLSLAAPAPPPPDFASHVLPHLTKAGCNQGTCHGAAIGRGGFRLSLLGGDPAADYDTIVREFGGRRVHLDTPQSSLVLRKAIGELGHGGGTRLAKTSAAYKTVETWLVAGAPAKSMSGKQLVGLQVNPQVALQAVGSRVPLTVTARYQDGSQENITALALYDTLDEAVARVDSRGSVTIMASGIAAIRMRFRGQVTAVRVGAPFPGRKSSIPIATKPPVDQALFAELARLNLAPAARCDDATFLRRAYLDLIGTLPTPQEVRSFLRDPQRERLVDTLLSRPEFTDLWTLKLADLLRISPKRFGPEGAQRYQAWLRGQVERKTPLNQLVQALLTQQEFWRTQSDPRDLSEFFARTWLGARVECARCHNHPYDRWTRDDYHAFAAAFGRPGQVPHPKTGKPVLARALGGTVTLSSRAELAAWASVSPRLAEALANRLWKEVFGQGLVEPVDDLRAANPAVYPSVLTAVTAELKRSGYDLRATLRSLVLSDAYQQRSGGKEPDKLFAHAVLKPLPAPVMADALVQATGGSLGLPGRAIALTDPATPSVTLDVLGRCQRDTDCANSTEAGGLSVAMHLLSGKPVQSLLTQGATQLCATYPSDPALVEELYLRTLSRFPSPAERAYAEGLLKHRRAQAVEDLLWALVNTREFSYNH